MKDAHGICVVTEWDEFKTYDYKVRAGGGDAQFMTMYRRQDRTACTAYGRHMSLVTDASRIVPPPLPALTELLRPPLAAGHLREDEQARVHL